MDYKMRIVLFALDHIEYTIELAEALSQHETLMLMIPKNRVQQFSNVISSNINLYAYDRPRLRYPTNLIMLFKVIRQLYKFKPDIIHIQGEHPWFDITLPFLIKKWPIINTVHDVILHTGDESSSRFPNFLYKINRTFADRFIVHGKILKQEFINIYQKENDKIHVLPRGINSIYTRYSSNKLNEEGDMILFFGRIWEYKGLKYFIEAEPLVTSKFPDVKFVIAGTGEDLDKYRQLMVNKEKFIIYDEYIPNEKVFKFFQNATIVVLPYIDASQSGVIPLAYAFRTPVIVTNVGSLSEVVEHNKTGLIVPPKDSRAIANSIISLLSDQTKIKTMGDNAYIKATTELSWDAIATKTIKIYHDTINARRSN